MSIPVKIDDTYQILKNGKIPENTSGKKISKDAILKFVDGGFYDCSSVTYAIRAWQQNNEITNKIKIICVNDTNIPTFSKGQRTDTTISLLFGCKNGTDMDGLYKNQKTYNYISNFSENPQFNLYTGVPQIFDSNDFKNGKKIWSDTSKECEISIMQYNNIVTLDNIALGIRKGTPVDLIVFEVNTEAPLLLYPGNISNKTSDKFISTEEAIYNSIISMDNTIFNSIISD